MPFFDEPFISTFTQLIQWRRDVRRFRSAPVAPELLEKLIYLASLSPSVGYSQPWRFICVRDVEARAQIRNNFLACNAAALGSYEGERAELYARLKLAGLDQAPEHIAVLCDTRTNLGHGLGRRTMPEMLEYSVVIACHTLWLTARAHGLGIGWVSILDPVEIQKTLRTPDTWKLVAYLCLGYPEEEHLDPELARHDWESYRRPDILIR